MEDQAAATAKKLFDSGFAFFLGRGRNRRQPQGRYIGAGKIVRNAQPFFTRLGGRTLRPGERRGAASLLSPADIRAKYGQNAGGQQKSPGMPQT